MDQVLVTKNNGKTFIGYITEQFNKNKKFIEGAGYRKATKEEVDKYMKSKGFVVKEEVKEKPIEKQKAKPIEELNNLSN